jgi:type VI secretion system secreted protein Hcp
MAERAFITISGQVQGTFAGDGSGGKNKDRIRIYSYAFSGQSLRDPATGHASGKRQYHPVVVTKEWGAASPQIWTAFATNELLTEVLIEFIGTNPHGLEQVDHSIKLTNTTITEVRDYTERVPPPDGTEMRPLDEVSFVFEKIEMHDKSGKEFTDDWAQLA